MERPGSFAEIQTERPTEDRNAAYPVGSRTTIYEDNVDALAFQIATALRRHIEMVGEGEPVFIEVAVRDNGERP